jgi:branched-chain amino acid transport system substrate-binding protein
MMLLGGWRRAGRAVGFGMVAAAMGAMGLVAGGPPAGAAAKGTPLVVGVIETETNSAECPSCHVTEAADTLKGWAKTVNAKGGIDGHPVTLIVLNTADDPGTAQSDLATLQSHNALAIVGEDASGTEPTWKTTINKDGMPVIGGTDYTTAPLTDPLYYPGTTSVIANVWGEWDAIVQDHVKSPKVASLLCSTSAVCVSAKTLNAAAAKSLNIPIVYNETAGATATTYTPQCLAMKASGANVISPQGINDATLVTDCARQGYKPVVITENEDATPEQIKSSSSLDGLLGPTPSFIPDEAFPQESGYIAMLKKDDPSLLPGGKQYDSTYFDDASTDAWVAAQIFQKGIENAAVPAKTTVTRADLIKGLSMFKTETLTGITPPLTYGNGKTPNPPTLCFYLYKQESSFKSTYEPLTTKKMKYYCEPAKDLPTS